MSNDLDGKKCESVRVLQFTTKLSYGGVQTFLMDYADHMDHSRVIFDYVIQTKEQGVFDEKVKAHGSRIFSVTPMTTSSLQYTRDVYRLLKQHPEYKIVHSHLNYRNILPLFAAKMAGVSHSHSHSHNDYTADNMKKQAMRKLFKLFLPFFATDYMACSMKAGEWLYGKNRVEKGKVQIIHNAIDPVKYEYSEAVRNRIRDRYGLGEKKVWIHIGTFGEAKNHPFLLRLFNEYIKHHKDAVLLLCGDGSNRDKIEKIIKDYGLQKNVLMLGMVDNVNEFLITSDIMLLPSLYEGLPLSTIEAQSSGCSCVVSAAVPEEAVFNDNVCICDSWELDQWLSAVERLIGHRVEYKESAKKLKKAGYDIRIEAEKLERYYLTEAGREVS